MMYTQEFFDVQEGKSMAKRQYFDAGKYMRNAMRLATHRYGKPRSEWTTAQIRKFLELNAQDEHGKYMVADWSIAQQLQCSLASVQYLRRKANMIRKNQEAFKGMKEIKLMHHSEAKLKDIIRSKV